MHGMIFGRFLWGREEKEIGRSRADICFFGFVCCAAEADGRLERLGGLGARGLGLERESDAQNTGT